MTSSSITSKPLVFRPDSLDVRTGSRNSPQPTLPNWLQPSQIEQFAFSPPSDLLTKPSQRGLWKPLAYQKVPLGSDWVYWALVAGRGTGKTQSGAFYVDEYAQRHAGHRIGIIAPTLGDARATCVEGETGLFSINRDIKFNRSWGELRWPNGAVGQLFGAYGPDDVERLRGPQFHLVWCDEFAAWRQISPAWDMMRLGLRLGSRPHAIITTTPKPRPKLMELLQDKQTRIALTDDGRIPTTEDNPHLHPDVRAELYRQFGGTRLGRQELGGEILTDVPGALWKRDTLELCRVSEHPDLVRVGVGVDPSGGTEEEHDEQGIIVSGLGVDGHGYVLADRSCKLSPDGWGRRAVQAYLDFKADRIFVEKNFGGDMAIATIQTAARAMGESVPVTAVSASRGKAVRAEPVAALYEQQRVHHVGSQPQLEDQMCNWVPGSHDGSPDRLDGLVWVLSKLMLNQAEVKFY